MNNLVGCRQQKRPTKTTSIFGMVYRFTIAFSSPCLFAVYFCVSTLWRWLCTDIFGCRHNTVADVRSTVEVIEQRICAHENVHFFFSLGNHERSSRTFERERKTVFAPLDTTSSERVTMQKFMDNVVNNKRWCDKTREEKFTWSIQMFLLTISYLTWVHLCVPFSNQFLFVRQRFATWKKKHTQIDCIFCFSLLSI